MTENDELCFKLMDGCHICGKRYTDKDVRVRNHCHITGKFRGSAHQESNLRLRIKPEDINPTKIFTQLVFELSRKNLRGVKMTPLVL